MRIIFFGADGWFSEPVLEALLAAGFKVPVVVTKGDTFVTPKSKIKNQKSKIIQAAGANDISIERLDSLLRSDLAAARLPAWQARSDLSTPDAIVLASFGPPFLGNDVLNWPKYGCLNVHASLLPRWRGASPVFACLREGDKETGVSIMRMTEEIDRGPVLGQAGLEIHQPGIIRPGLPSEGRAFPNHDTRESLTKRLGKLGGELIVETLKKLEKGQITDVTQPIKSPTPYTRRLTKQSGRINWSQSPIEIERLIRAVTPWPGAWTEYKDEGRRTKDEGKVIKILKVHLERIQNSEFPARQSLALQAPAGGKIQNYLIIDEVQLPGKNPVSWKQFLAGHPEAEFVHFSERKD